MKKIVSFNFFKVNAPFLTLLGILTLFYYILRGLNSTISNILGLLVIILGLIKLFNYNKQIAYFVFGIIIIYIIFF